MRNSVNQKVATDEERQKYYEILDSKGELKASQEQDSDNEDKIELYQEQEQEENQERDSNEIEGKKERQTIDCVKIEPYERQENVDDDGIIILESPGFENDKQPDKLQIKQESNSNTVLERNSEKPKKGSLKRTV